MNAGTAAVIRAALAGERIPAAGANRPASATATTQFAASGRTSPRSIMKAPSRDCLRRSALAPGPALRPADSGDLRRKPSASKTPSKPTSPSTANPTPWKRYLSSRSAACFVTSALPSRLSWPPTSGKGAGLLAEDRSGATAASSNPRWRASRLIDARGELVEWNDRLPTLLGADIAPPAAGPLRQDAWQATASTMARLVRSYAPGTQHETSFIAADGNRR